MGKYVNKAVYKALWVAILQIAGRIVKKDSKPVRNVLRVAPHRVVGQFAWVKTKRANVRWESRPERDAIRVLAVHPSVSFVEDQPCTISYRFDGKLHKYTPDLRIFQRGKPSIIEVKEFEEANKPENQARFMEIARVFAYYDLTFTVWTDREFRRQPLLNNATRVLRYRNFPFECTDANKVSTLLASHECLTATELSKHLGSAISTESLFAMVCHGLIHLDCDQPLGDNPIFQRLPTDDTERPFGSIY